MPQVLTSKSELTTNKIMEDFKTFLRFPTISSDSTKKQAIQHCAQWLSDHLKNIGLQNVVLYQTKQHPIVYAEYIVDPSMKTILFYGHYDVQPVTPVSDWKFPPFHPTIVGDYIYARGASDDKGQMFVHIKAIEYALQNKNSLGVNIKCMFEGEEEIGSPHLPSFMYRNRDLLGCDVAIVSDTKMLSPDYPAITYSLRGSLNAEIIIKTARKDLHSGTFGGVVNNPANVLSKIIASIHDENGRITIPGFYSGMIDEEQDERSYMKVAGPSDESLRSDAGISTDWGEPGFSNYERTTIRPSVVVTTLQSGHIGEGCKNVLPSVAIAKINIRIVRGQQPRQIALLFARFVKYNIPPGVHCKVKFSSASKPVQLSRRNPYLKAASHAYAKAFGRTPAFIRSGGTIPVVSLFHDYFKIPVVLMGFALASDNMHAPNERFYLPNLIRSIRTSIHFIKIVSTSKT
jgi:acetylornithine deacetylase/succinyl-diaminopimelate desuccinylase-like protein